MSARKRFFCGMLAGLVCGAVFAVVAWPSPGESSKPGDSTAPSAVMLSSPVHDAVEGKENVPLASGDPISAVCSVDEIVGYGVPFSLVQVRCVSVETGAPVPRIRFQVSSNRPGVGGSTFLSDGQGVAEVKLCVGGTYTIKTQWSGLQGDSQPPLWGWTRFDIPEEAGSVYCVDHKLSKGLDLNGELVDAVSGRPLAGYEIRCSSMFGGSPVGYDTKSGPHGEFSFEGLVPGKWKVGAIGRIGKHKHTVKEIQVSEDERFVHIAARQWDNN